MLKLNNKNKRVQFEVVFFFYINQIFWNLIYKNNKTIHVIKYFDKIKQKK